MNTDTLIRDVEGDLFIGPSRVLLQNIVTAKHRGEAPEEIQANFPSITLTQVYGAILFYLEHHEEIDARFAEEQRVLDEMRAARRAADAEFYDAMHARFEAARKQDRECSGHEITEEQAEAPRV